MSTPGGCSPLHGDENLEKIKQSLKDGLDPNGTCLDGQTPLYWSRSGEITKALIEAGGDPRAYDSHLTTPLHVAPDAESVELLIQKGADVNALNDEGNTPLHTAKNAAIIEALIKYGAHINVRNKEGYTPLERHMERCNVPDEVILIFQKHGGVSRGLTELAQHRAEIASIKAYQHEMLGSLILPTFILGILALRACSRHAHKLGTFARSTSNSSIYTLVSGIFILLNPLVVLMTLVIALFFGLFGHMLPLWQYVGPHTNLTHAHIVGLCLYGYLALRKKKTPLPVLCMRNIPYAIMLPLYIVFGWAATGVSGRDEVGLSFFGLPLFALFWGIGFSVSRRIQHSAV